MSKITGFLVDVENSKVGVVQFEDELEEIYKILGVELIDVAVRKVGKYEYDIIADDEGLLKDSPKPSAFDSKLDVQLVGNLLFVNHDAEGNFDSLTNEQIEDLKKYVFGYDSSIGTEDGDTVSRPCVVGMEYC